MLYASHVPDIIYRDILQWSDSCQSRQIRKNGQESSLGKAFKNMEYSIYYMNRSFFIFALVNSIVLGTKEAEGKFGEREILLVATHVSIKFM